MSKIKRRLNERRKPNGWDFVLLGIFILLAVFIVYLLFRLKDARWEYSHSKVDFIMPVIEENLNTIEVNVGGKKKGDKINYLFNVTNFRDQDVNKTDYKYKFYVDSNTKATYEIYLKGQNTNLLDENNMSEYYTIKGKKKEIKTYKLKVKLKEDQPKESVIYLYIEGKK